VEDALHCTSKNAFTMASILTFIAASPLAYADGTVNVILQDATSASDMTGMKMTATPDSVIAGRVTIHATNQSQGLVHEVIVVRPPTNDAKLPYDDKTGRVIEKKIKHLGEVSDLPPGKSGSLTVRLTRANICSSATSRTTIKQGCGPTLP
jgi:uncharacterized cupredoxin-like copper-binding protein